MMGEPKPVRFAKHTSFFQIEKAKEYDKLYEDLGIIGEISYDDDMSVDESPSGDISPRTPKLKRPNDDLRVRCQTPRKPRRNWRLNVDDTPQAPKDILPFKFCGRRSSRYYYQPTLSVLSLPNEVALHVFKFLDLTSLCRCMQVCKLWKDIASDNMLWKALNLRFRNISVTDLQRFLHNQASAVCLNSTSIYNDSRNVTWAANSYSRGNNTTPIFSSSYNDRCLSNCRTIRVLNLSLCKDMTVYGLIEVLLALDKLVELNLSWSSACKYGVEEVFSSLPPGLTHLNIAGFRETLLDGHIGIIISRCSRLQELDVSDSNHITSHAVDMIVQGLSNSLRGINLSRCYSVTPDCYLRFMNMPFLHFLDVFGVMDDVSVAALSEALPRVNVSLRPFSAVARPTPTMCMQSVSSESTIWGHHVKL